jgi:hypothetical protein
MNVKEPIREEVYKLSIDRIRDAVVPMRPIDKNYLQNLLEKEDLSKLPPIKVDENFCLISGQHRLEVFRRKQLKNIEVIVISGLTDWEKWVLSIQENVNHGCHLTLDNKREMAKLMRSVGKTYSEIAVVFGVNERTVSNWCAVGVTEEENEVELEKLVEKWCKVTDTLWENLWGSGADDEYFPELIEIVMRKLASKKPSITDNIEKVCKDYLECLEIHQKNV